MYKFLGTSEIKKLKQQLLELAVIKKNSKKFSDNYIKNLSEISKKENNSLIINLMTLKVLKKLYDKKLIDFCNYNVASANFNDLTELLKNTFLNQKVAVFTLGEFAAKHYHSKNKDIKNFLTSTERKLKVAYHYKEQYSFDMQMSAINSWDSVPAIAVINYALNDKCVNIIRNLQKSSEVPLFCTSYNNNTFIAYTENIDNVAITALIVLALKEGVLYV